MRLTLALGGAWALAGCSGGRSGRAGGGVGSVGDPLPGESVADLGPSEAGRDGVLDPRTEHLLRRWRGRRGSSGLPEGVIARNRWAAQGPKESLADAMGGVGHITVHHDGMSPYRSTTRGDAMRRIEAIRSAHRGRGWADIGYHFAVDPAGRVYECRPTRLQGAHVKHHNEHNVGIVVLGNFMEQRPTLDARRAVDALVADQMRRYGVPVSRVHTHRELRPTACPGTHLQRHMEAARSSRGALAIV